MTTADVARSSIVVLVVLIVQHAVLDPVRVAGAHPDIVVLLPIAAGYVAGPDRGAGFGFVCGIVADLLLPTTFGLSALIYCLLGYVTGVSTASLVKSSWTISSLVFATGAAAGLSAYALLGSLLGNPLMLSHDLLPALIMSVPLALMIGAPMAQFVSWALPAPGSAPEPTATR